jgi:hypothetical protein
LVVLDECSWINGWCHQKSFFMYELKVCKMFVGEAF